MENVDDLIEQLRLALAIPVRLPRQAGSIAMNIFLLSQIHQMSDDPRVRGLHERSREALCGSTFEDLLGHQLRYASRLASSPGQLEYEEMHKLLSLCDEIHALRLLGFSADEASIRQFEADVRVRFARQSRAARMTAEDRTEEWNKELWWYAEPLSFRPEEHDDG